jgi:hypothetical protein
MTAPDAGGANLARGGAIGIFQNPQKITKGIFLN